MSEIVWRPDEATLRRANATRLVERSGAASYAELVDRSVAEPDWFWALVVEDLGLEFARPWTRVLDDSRGPAWATWFVDGTVSIAHNCAHRWASSNPAGIAAVGLGEDGSRRELTFAELSRDVTRLAEQLVSLGVGAGDRVAIFLPMSPDVAVASHAIAHIGAIQVPVFSGFAAPAVAQRLQASGAKVVITQTESSRRGKAVPMLAILEAALREAPTVEHVVLAPFELDAFPGELPARRSTRRRRTSSRTRPAPPARRKGSSMCKGASSSRSPARSPTRRTSMRATSSTSPPTWAGSWGRGPSSASARSARRSSSPRARRTGPRRTDSGRRSSRSESRRSACRPPWRERCCRTARPGPTCRRSARS